MNTHFANDLLAIRRYALAPSLSGTNPKRPKVSIETGDRRGLVGMAATFYDGTRATEFRLGKNTYERIKRGAFDRAIREMDDTIACFNHNRSKPLGRRSDGTLKLAVSFGGLEYFIEESNSPTYRDTHEFIKRGDVTGSSFYAFLAKSDYAEFEERGRWIRAIHNVSFLADVSPVVSPCYTATTVSVRSSDYHEARERDDYLARLERQCAIDRELYLREMELKALRVR